jgi:hypothetical protein
LLDPSDYANSLAQTVSDLVAQIEVRLIWEIARDVNRGLGGGSRYEVDMTARYGALYARLQKQLGKPWKNVLTTVQAALDKAAEAGQGMAERDLAGRLANHPETLGVPITNVRALEVIASDLHRVLADLPALALRNAFDSYQQIISTPAALNATGVLTRRKATQDALSGFAARGIDGFTDKAGRTWHIDTYAEMATRTGAAHSLRAAYEGELIARGEDLVIVTGNTYTCRLCAPWQDKVLSLTGMYPAGTHRLPSAVGDGYVTVHVAGTMEEARAAGLHHPNCTHSEGLYLPGATVIEPGTMGVRDAETYDASQKQRALEREIRKHKRLLVAAITGEAETKARAAIRGYQAQIRELLAEHPKLQRKSYREAVPKPSGFHTWTCVAGPKKPLKGVGPRPGPYDLLHHYGKPKLRADLIARAKRMETVKSDLSRLKDSLGRWMPDQILDHHEIDFLERFERLGHRARWIPRSTLHPVKGRLSTNDFEWIDFGSEICEHKGVTAKYSSIADRISETVLKAADHDVIKDFFVIDLGKRKLSGKLRYNLSQYNKRRPDARIRRLWIMADNGSVFEPIKLE